MNATLRVRGGTSLEELHFVCGGLLSPEQGPTGSNDGNALHFLISVTTPAAMVEPTYLSMKRPSSL